MSVPRPIVENQSSVKTYNNCRRLYGWGRIERLDVPLHRSAPEIGTAVHEGLRVAHSEGGTIEAGQSTAVAKLEERAGPSTRFEDKDLDEAKEIVERVFTAYFEHWKDRGQVWTPLDNEVQFRVEIQPGWWNATFGVGEQNESDEKLQALWEQIPHTGIFLRGKADNLSVHAGGLWLVDYKTAGKMDPRDLLKYDMDMQLTAYIYGITKQLTEDSVREGKGILAVRGAIIDLLVKTQTPQFARETFTRSVQEMAEFEHDFVEYCSEIREKHERVRNGEDWKKVFPKNTEHCFRYGTCQFRDLCLKDTDIRRTAYVQKEADYVEVSQKELEDAWEASGRESYALPPELSSPGAPAEAGSGDAADPQPGGDDR